MIPPQVYPFILSLICSYFCLTLSAWANPITENLSLLEQGVSAYQTGDYLGAVDAFTQQIDQTPDSAVAYVNRCLVRLQLQKYQLALTDCDQAITLSQGNTDSPDRFNQTTLEALLNRGLSHYNLGEYTAALSDYQQLLALNPDDYRAYYNMGLTQVSLGNYNLALEHYSQALGFKLAIASPILSLIYTDRGVSRMLLAQYSEAVSDFTEALTLDSENVWAYFNRGCANHRDHNFIPALADFSRVIAVDVENAQAYFNRGIIYVQLEKPEDAIANFKQAAQHFQYQGSQQGYQKSVRWIEKLTLPSSEPIGAKSNFQIL